MVVVGVTDSIVSGNLCEVVLRVVPLHKEPPPTTPQPTSSLVNQFTGAALVVVQVAVACMVHDNDVAHRVLVLLSLLCSSDRR